MSINIDPRPSSEVLMDALASVEKADKVVILLECDAAICVKTNCSHKDLKWVLDQATFAAMNDLFGVKTDEPS